MRARKETISLRRNGFDIDIYGTAYGGIMWAFCVEFLLSTISHIGVKKKLKRGRKKKNQRDEMR